MVKEIVEQLLITKIRLKAFIEHEGKLLLTHDIGRPKWDVPGGRLHIGEKPEEGLRREVMEEVGITIAVGKPFFTIVAADGHFTVMYRATLANSDAQITLASDEVAEYIWIEPNEIDKSILWPEYADALAVYLEV